MKKSSGFLEVSLLIISIFIVSSCKKEDGGSLIVKTIQVSDITYHSAVSGVEWIGTADSIKEGGICYSTKAEPTPADNVSGFDVVRLKSVNTGNFIYFTWR